MFNITNKMRIFQMGFMFPKDIIITLTSNLAPMKKIDGS